MKGNIVGMNSVQMLNNFRGDLVVMAVFEMGETLQSDLQGMNLVRMIALLLDVLV